MDLRIANTCNNNCLYCLEQGLRSKEKYVDKQKIFNEIGNNRGEIITFYGGNPLLHPYLEEILAFCKDKGFTSIGILTNTFGINKEKLDLLVNAGLTSIGFYFNSFNKKNQKLITNDGIGLKTLLENIFLIKKSGISCKAIIHINKQNIGTVANDILKLNRYFGINSFEFINYFPFDRLYEKYRNLLEYNIRKERKNIDKVFAIVKKEKLKVNFLKFSRNFFGEYLEYYDFERGILKQIGNEDRERLLSGKEKAFCFLENRCKNCFIRDNCYVSP